MTHRMKLLLTMLCLGLVQVSVPTDLAALLRDDPRNGELQQAMIHIETLQAGFADTLNPALGLSLGFNSTDGD